MTDADLAAHLAETAGRLLLEVRASGLFSAKALGKAGDQTANQFLCHALREARPDDGLLSEEEKDNAARIDKARVWIVDPVDGTREYGEARADWRHPHLGADPSGFGAEPGAAPPPQSLRAARPRWWSWSSWSCRSATRRVGCGRPSSSFSS